MKNNLTKKRALAEFEMFLLVASIISFSALLSGIYSAKEVSAISLPSSSAEQCCLTTKQGASCIDLPLSDACKEQCSGTCQQTSCSEVSECKSGCGFDKENGLCTPNTPKKACDESPSCEFFDDAFCNINECQKGCCILGTNSMLATRTQCEKLSKVQGVPSEFHLDTPDELQCISLSQNANTGACVFGDSEEPSCKFTTKSDCESTIKGIFYQDYLCSNPELKTKCEKQKSTSCVEGKDGVYWFDSCGNQENIYSSDKIRSWNNGKVLSKEQSCNPNSANADSANCGNCNYELGGICGESRTGTDTKPTYGNYVCRDLNCKDAPDNGGGKANRINGESWCVFDGPVGTGSIASGKSSSGLGDILQGITLGGEIGLMSTDLVGSRHFRYVCQNGEVVSEPCADYRKEICVQNKKSLDNGKQIDEALCRVNMWEQCISLNGGIGSLAGQMTGGAPTVCGPECLFQCIRNPDCRLQPVLVDTDFWFTACVPKYPPGFDLGETSGLSGLASSGLSSALGSAGGIGEIAGSALGSLGGGNSGGSSAQQVCSVGTQTCTAIYVKMCPGGWKCVKNCQCEEIGFTLQMNNLCASLGDCGVYANIAGQATGLGAIITKKGSHGKTPPQPFILIPLYMALAKILKGQPSNGGFFNNVGGILQLPLYGISSMFGMTLSDLSPSVGMNFLGRASAGFNPAFTAGATGAGAYAGAATSMSLFGPSSIIGFTGAFIGAAIVIGIMYLLGCGQVEKVEIKFECKPWDRPFGDGKGIFDFGKGSRCDFCNKDPLKICSKYRCESLGTRCTLINENTGEDKCVSIEGEATIPIITPWEEILNKTFFKYQDSSTNGFRVRTSEGECIQAFTPVVFGVKTDVYSQCRWDIYQTGFENMSYEFFESGKFTKNHTLSTVLPSVESLVAGETGSVEEFNEAMSNQSLKNSLLNALGDMNIYVKCANLDGKANDQDYKINFCVKPGPDLTPPVVIATAPAENSVVAFNATEQETLFYINEPAECKWDLIRPNSPTLENYNSMANTLTCDTNMSSQNILGFPCIATLPVVSGENKYYLLCRDQPWLEDNSSRNLGASAGKEYEYILKTSASTLEISELKPEGIITRGTEPVSVTLEAETSGGADSGNSVCYYSLNESNGYIRFFETATNKHKQILTSMTKGDYTLKVKCIDVSGNVGVKTSSFSLQLDGVAPEVTRVFYNSGTLTLNTNEDSICHYGDSVGCIFDANSSVMNGANSKSHTASIEKNSTYYILCEDIWGNKKSGCSIELTPYQT